MKALKFQLAATARYTTNNRMAFLLALFFNRLDCYGAQCDVGKAADKRYKGPDTHHFNGL
jgi:hypothetical protein